MRFNLFGNIAPTFGAVFLVLFLLCFSTVPPSRGVEVELPSRAENPFKSFACGGGLHVDVYPDRLQVNGRTDDEEIQYERLEDALSRRPAGAVITVLIGENVAAGRAIETLARLRELEHSMPEGAKLSLALLTAASIPTSTQPLLKLRHGYH